MKNSTVTTNTIMMVLCYLLTPEDSSATTSERCPLRGVTRWNRAKPVLWLVFSVLAALLVGQL